MYNLKEILCNTKKSTEIVREDDRNERGGETQTLHRERCGSEVTEAVIEGA
jgi:hypothetical protein